MGVSENKDLEFALNRGRAWGEPGRVGSAPSLPLSGQASCECPRGRDLQADGHQVSLLPPFLSLGFECLFGDQQPTGRVLPTVQEGSVCFQCPSRLASLWL